MRMGWFFLVEVFSVALVALFLISQILTPLLWGTPLFPLLRRKSKLADAEGELADATEDGVVRNLRQKARSARRGDGL